MTPPERLSRRSLLLTALPACAPARADATPLHVLIDGSIEMPQVQIKGDQPVDGLQYLIAVELGRRLGRPLRFHLVPRRRVPQLLLDGQEADLICNYMPGWLPGPLQWSRPYLDDGDLLITAARRPAAARLQDLSGQPIGTVAGFQYPEVEAVLGAGFRRDDAPNLVNTLRKMAAGRVDHAIVGHLSFDYLQRRGEVPLALYPPVELTRLRTGCALSPHSSLSLARLNAALAAMQADGTLTRIVDRYR